jgi:hypothetical protein
LVAAFCVLLACVPPDDDTQTVQQPNTLDGVTSIASLRVPSAVTSRGNQVLVGTDLYPAPTTNQENLVVAAVGADNNNLEYSSALFDMRVRTSQSPVGSPIHGSIHSHTWLDPDSIGHLKTISNLRSEIKAMNAYARVDVANATLSQIHLIQYDPKIALGRVNYAQLEVASGRIDEASLFYGEVYLHGGTAGNVYGLRLAAPLGYPPEQWTAIDVTGPTYLRGPLFIDANGASQQVQVGDADSCGAGHRCLFVSN